MIAIFVYFFIITFINGTIIYSLMEVFKLNLVSFIINFIKIIVTLNLVNFINEYMVISFTTKTIIIT